MRTLRPRCAPFLYESRNDDTTSWTETFVRRLADHEADLTAKHDEASRGCTPPPFSLGTVAVGNALRADQMEDEGIVTEEPQAEAYRSGSQADLSIGDALRAVSEERPEDEEEDADIDYEEMTRAELIAWTGNPSQESVTSNAEHTASRVRFVSARHVMASTQPPSERAGLAAKKSAMSSRARAPLEAISSQASVTDGDSDSDKDFSPMKRSNGLTFLASRAESQSHQGHSVIESYDSRSYPSHKSDEQTQSTSKNQSSGGGPLPSDGASNTQSQSYSESNSMDAALRAGMRATPLPASESRVDVRSARSPARMNARPQLDRSTNTLQRSRSDQTDDRQKSASPLKRRRERESQTSPPSKSFRTGHSDLDRSKPSVRGRDVSTSRLVLLSSPSGQGRQAHRSHQAPTPGEGTAQNSLVFCQMPAATSAQPPRPLPRPLQPLLQADSRRAKGANASVLHAAHAFQAKESQAADGTSNSMSYTSLTGADSVPPPPPLRFNPSGVTSISMLLRQPHVFLSARQGGPRSQTSAVRFNLLALVREVGPLDEVGVKVFKSGKLVQGRVDMTFRSSLILQDGRDGALLKVTLWGECARQWAGEGEAEDDSGNGQAGQTFDDDYNTSYGPEADGTSSAIGEGFTTLLRTGGPRTAAGGGRRPKRPPPLRAGDVISLESVILSMRKEAVTGSTAMEAVASARTSSSVELCWRCDPRGERDMQRYTFDPALAAIDRRCKDVWRCAQLWRR
ncbi:unnamed protein product [Jaminaea pallidilutea]